MTNKTDHVNMATEAHSSLRVIAQELAWMAGAFYNVGNERISQQLDAMSKVVSDNADLAWNAYDAVLTEAFQATQDATHNMVQAALNVIATRGETHE